MGCLGGHGGHHSRARLGALRVHSVRTVVVGLVEKVFGGHTVVPCRVHTALCLDPVERLKNVRARVQRRVLAICDYLLEHRLEHRERRGHAAHRRRCRIRVERARGGRIHVNEVVAEVAPQHKGCVVERLRGRDRLVHHGIADGAHCSRRVLSHVGRRQRLQRHFTRLGRIVLCIAPPAEHGNQQHGCRPRPPPGPHAGCSDPGSTRAPCAPSVHPVPGRRRRGSLGHADSRHHGVACAPRPVHCRRAVPGPRLVGWVRRAL